MCNSCAMNFSGYQMPKVGVHVCCVVIALFSLRCGNAHFILVVILRLYDALTISFSVPIYIFSHRCNVNSVHSLSSIASNESRIAEKSHTVSSLFQRCRETCKLKRKNANLTYIYCLWVIGNFESNYAMDASGRRYECKGNRAYCEIKIMNRRQILNTNSLFFDQGKLEQPRCRV